MPIITNIKPQKSEQRVNIYLDGKFAFGLPTETLVKAGLVVNQELTEAEIKKLKNIDAKEKAFNRALKFLSYRPRSEKEVVDYLVKKETGKGHAFQVIKKLKKLKFLDDGVFVAWWVEQRNTFRPRGKRGLLFELRQKGIDSKLAEKVIEKTVDEVALAKKAAAKKMRAYRKLDKKEAKKKMIAFLSRQGFTWETIKKALDEMVKKG